MLPSDDLSKEGVFYDAAKADAALRNWGVDSYLDQMGSKMIELLQEEDVFDRVSLKDSLQRKAATKGSLTFVTGSRSIGKTKLLGRFAEEHKSSDSDLMVIFVNGRSGSVATGIKSALNDLKDKQWYDDINWSKIKDLMQSANQASKSLTATNPAAAAGAEAATCGLSHMFDLLKLTGEDESAELISLITIIAEAKGKHPCLIIDEANLVAKANEDTQLLSRIIKHTKEDFKLSVILCTSVHSYPAVMNKHFNFGFATSRLAEELSPKTMFDILTKEEKIVGDGKKEKLVGMGPNLSRLCVASCGGNLLRVHTTIQQLLDEKERFSPLQNIFRQLLEGASEIAALMKDPACKKIIIEMAQKGYYEITTETKNEEQTRLVKRGVAAEVTRNGLVNDSHLLEDFPPEFLMPSSQSLRAYIVQGYPNEFKN